MGIPEKEGSHDAHSSGRLQEVISKNPEKVIFQQIDPSMLTNVNDADDFMGRGSFGRVKVQLYRGVLVAVK